MYNLTEIDRKILSILYEDCSLTNKEIAARLDIPKTTCLERVRRLRNQGAIKGYHADLNISALGANLQAMAYVRMKEHSMQLANSFRDDIIDLSEVLTMYNLGGEFDYAIHLALRDSNHLRDFVFAALTSRSEVEQIQTMLIFEHVQSRTLPIFLDEND